MKFTAGILLLGGVFIAGCHTAKEVAVTSFRVIDTPARFVRERIDAPRTDRVNAEVAASSDAVVYPGRPIEPAPQPQRRSTTTTRTSQREAEPTPRATARPTRTTASNTPRPSTAPSQPRTTSTSATAQLPTAKPVPGKPGYVFRPFDPSGGYVDVNGYTSGQKVKDPYSGKIFLVP